MRRKRAHLHLRNEIDLLRGQLLHESDGGIVAPRKQPAAQDLAAKHDLGCARCFGEFRDLQRNVCAVRDRLRRARLLCKTQIDFELPRSLCAKRRVRRRLDIERCEFSPKCARKNRAPLR